MAAPSLVARSRWGRPGRPDERGYPQRMARSESVLGDFIRQQRELQDLSVRAFAEMAGISNPYLSQIERGLRAPSEQVLDAIASSLHMSADALRREAGIPEDPPDGADQN